MKLLIQWILHAVAILLIALYVPGIEVAGFYTALIAVAVFSIINALLGTILKILTLPINILTLGLFALVINALLFWFTASILEGFEVAGFVPALYGAVLMWFVSALTNWLFE